MSPDERLELDIIFQSDRERRITVAAKSKPERRAPVQPRMTLQEQAEETAAWIARIEALEPWQRRALRAVLLLIDNGTIRRGSRYLARDIRDVIDAYREHYETGGAQ